MWLSAQLAALGRPDSPELELVVSELVTNAIEHGEGPVSIDVSVRDPFIRVEVADEGEQLPNLRDPAGRDKDGGFGLRIVDKHAAAWGVKRVPPSGKEVWIEFPLPAAS